MKTRRKFLTTLMQGVIGICLVGTGSYLVFREKKAESCTLEFTCTLCGKTEQCGLPAAKSFRSYEQQKKEGR